MHDNLASVLPEAVSALPPSALEELERFRAQALEQGIPTEEVDKWIGLARPYFRLGRKQTEGPVVGRPGGPLMLPPDVPTPQGRDAELQLIVTLDLSAIPQDATDLPLPPGGRLLLFANPDIEAYTDIDGGAVYVPAGTPVEEREAHLEEPVYEYGTPEELDEDLRCDGELRLRHGVSLPYNGMSDEFLAPYPHADELQEIWDDALDKDPKSLFTGWHVGGYAWDHDDYGDPVARSASRNDHHRDVETRPEDWVLLAQWNGLYMAAVYWTITRQDLEARRFDRVIVTMYANP